jgi:hypothetical protein
MDDQRIDREGGEGVNLDAAFRAELDEILKWSSEFTIEREPLSETDREDLRALRERMEEFKKKWKVGPNFKFPTR